MTGFTLTRSPAGVVLHVDGQPVTGVVSEEQAIAAVLRLTAEAGRAWRGAFVWPDTGDGAERVLERVGGPASTLEAQAASAAVRWAYYGRPTS